MFPGEVSALGRSHAVPFKVGGGIHHVHTILIGVAWTIGLSVGGGSWPFALG